MSYEFVKIYADLVTDDGLVLVLYQAWVRFFRRWYSRGGVELHHPDGGTRIVHGRVESPPPAPERVLEEKLRLRLRHADFELVLREREAPFEPDRQPCSGLEWRVLAARTAASARGLDSGREITGTGYVDWVRIVRATRRLGLRELRWGRVHLADSTVVFNTISLADGTVWSRGAEWSRPAADARLFESHIDLRQDGAARLGLGERALAIEPERMLTRGASLSRERLPGAIERGIARLVGGPTNELRWLGNARFEPSAPEAPAGTALYERVRFG